MSRVMRRFAIYAGLWLAGLAAFALLALVTSGPIRQPNRVRADAVADVGLAPRREETRDDSAGAEARRLSPGVKTDR
jgi:hypothetical protein